MSFKRSSRLFASAAVTAGLAFGGLSMAAPAAEAATQSATATYTCTTPLPGPLASFQVPATISLENLPDVLTANVPVPAGLPLVTTLDFSATGLLPSLIFTLQSTVNTVLGNVPGASALAGPVNTVFSSLANGVATVTSQLGEFTPTGTSLPVPVPTSLDFGNLTGLFSAIGIKCALNSDSVKQPAGVPVQKQGAVLKAKAKPKAGHKAIVVVKIKTTAGQRATGAVIAKVRGVKAKMKSLKNGKVRFVLKGLHKGKNKIKVRYLGNGFTNPAKQKVSVRIAR